jgi:hypothetical protein
MGESAEEITGALQLPIHSNKCNGRLLSLPECLVCRSSVMHYERVDGTLRRMGWHCGAAIRPCITRAPFAPHACRIGRGRTSSPVPAVADSRRTDGGTGKRRE